ncbi:MAG: hypothetical protein DRG20_03380 [Deltaproteobacteria bacterium]|nr:MAG: hypothetical protein DRG20_03380 [Deltaproteobacteria bacterium]
MKRGFSFLAIFFLVILLAIPASAAKLNITLTAGSVGGAWAAIGQGVGECIRKLEKNTVFTLQPGRDGANAIRVNSGKADLGIVHLGIAKAAINGTEPFKKPYKDVRAITILYSRAMYHFVILKKSGITDIAQIKAKKYPLKVSMNTKGSYMEIVGKNILAGYGITYNDIKKWGGQVNFLAMRPSFPLIKDGRIEAISNVIQVPSSHIKELATTHKLRLLPIRDDIRKKVAKKLSLKLDVIPASAYNFIDKDIPTVSASVVLICSAKMPEDVAYTITKAIHKNLSYLAKVHRALKALNAKSMAQVGDVPLHPGALKYYKEIGVIK